MTDDALDVLRELVATIDRVSPVWDLYPDELAEAMERARALLAAQEPRPEPDAWLLNDPISPSQIFTERPTDAEIGGGTLVPLYAAPSPAQQTMAAECESTDRNETGTTRAARGPSAKAEHDEPVAQSVATPTVEIDEQRIAVLAVTACNNARLSPVHNARFVASVLRTAWRESALAERQRAADDARDAARYRWWRDNYGSAYDGPGTRLLYTLIQQDCPLGTHAQFDAAIDNAMSAQGDA